MMLFTGRGIAFAFQQQHHSFIESSPTLYRRVKEKEKQVHVHSLSSFGSLRGPRKEARPKGKEKRHDATREMIAIPYGWTLTPSIWMSVIGAYSSSSMDWRDHRSQKG